MMKGGCKMSEQAYYFSHDWDAREDKKCVALIEQLGLEGYGIFWILIEILRMEADHTYPLTLIPAIARKYNTTTEKMKAVVLNYELFVIIDDKFFYSESLIYRLSLHENKREQARLAGVKSGEIRRLQANERTFNGRSTDVEQEKKRKEKKIRTPLPPFQGAIVLFSNPNFIEPFNSITGEPEPYTKAAYSFWKLFKQNMAELKIKSPALEKANSEKWADQIRLMMENDKRTSVEINEVYFFLKNEIQTAKFCWKRVIRSTENLRKHFDSLLISARSEKITPQIAQEPPRKTLKIIE